MRHMTNEHGNTIKVVEHIILRNYWEYYIVEAADEDGIVFALVVGDYTELGYVSMDEIMPAPMWSWCTDKHDFDQSYSTEAELY